MVTARNPFWQRHPGLVWSNPEADDSVYIRAALLRGGYERLLDIAMEFGLEQMRNEWKVLRDEGTLRAQRASAAVERVLANIEKGFALAASQN